MTIAEAESDPEPEPEPEPQPVPVNKLVEFVKRCYRVLLGREADESGLKAWSDKLISGELSAAEVLQGFVFSDEFTSKNLTTEEALNRIGSMMLSREEDISSFIADVRQGRTVSSAINGLSASNEFDGVRKEYDIETDFGNENGVRTDIIRVRAFITRCYRALTGREPDSAGMNYWAEGLASGKMTAAQVVMGFLDSEEFAARKLGSEATVNALYQAVLDRTPDETGKALWVSKLDSNQPLSTVVNGLCGSDEFKKICEETGINPGQASSGGQSGGEPEPVPSVPTWNEGKVREFINRCYLKGLKREADVNGLEYWTQTILTGENTPEQVAQKFLTSAELKALDLNDEDFIRMLYAVLLDREAGAEEVSVWVGRLSGEKQRPRSWLIQAICKSEEFKKILESMKNG